MGFTYVEGVLTGPTGKQATLRFLVDGGATYTLVPHDVSQALNLPPKPLLRLRWPTALRLSVSSPSVTLHFPKARDIRGSS